jgi:bifunctional enzyme CysN/CysC
LSGSGKSTIANLLEKQLHAAGAHAYVLDGDNLRMGLNVDLGFTPEDRAENVRRVSEVAKLMVDAGLIVITALVSPFEVDRQRARSIFAEGDFVEVLLQLMYVYRAIQKVYIRRRPRARYLTSLVWDKITSARQIQS